jgi:hypothetical protein
MGLSSFRGTLQLAIAGDNLSTQTSALRASQDQTTAALNTMITRVDSITSNTAAAAQTLGGLKGQIQQTEKVIEAAAQRIDRSARLLDKIDRRDYGILGRIFGRKSHGSTGHRQPYLPGNAPPSTSSSRSCTTNTVGA